MIDHGKKLNRFFFDQELMLQTFLFTSNYNKVFQGLKKLNEKIGRIKQSPKIGIFMPLLVSGCLRVTILSKS